MSNPSYFVSVVIPSFNEEKYVSYCLSSIAQLNVSPHKCEVVVVDNGSRDRTYDIVKSYEDVLSLRVYVVKDVSIGALRNFGASKAKGNIFAFLDADCSVSREWLQKAVHYFDTPDIAAVGSSHLTPDSSSWVAITWDKVIGRKRKKAETDNLPSGNLWVRKKSFWDIGGFNEQLTTNEDFDLCFRLSRQGYLLYSDPEIKAWHWGVPEDLVGFYCKTKWHGTNAAKVFFENLWELKNARSIMYGLYYFIALISIPVVFVIFETFFALAYLIVSLVMPPCLLSLRIMLRNRSFDGFFKLCLLFLTYGVARAHSLFDSLGSLLVSKEKGAS